MNQEEFQKKDMKEMMWELYKGQELISHKQNKATTYLNNQLNRFGSSLLRYAGTFAGALFAFGSWQMGPIDMSRALYNSAIGETNVLKQQLYDYSHQKLLEDRNAGSATHVLQQQLGVDNYTLPRDIPLDRLFKVAEINADNFVDEWIWTDLRKK